MSAEAGSRPTTSASIKSIPLDPGLCRNITIHGYCKWQDKGCRFNHGEPKIVDSGAGRLRPETPTFTPTSTANSSHNSASTNPSSAAPSTAYMIGIGAPVFVPRGGASSPSQNFVAEQQTNHSSPLRHSSNLPSSATKSSPQSMTYTSLDNPAMRSSTLSTVPGFSSPQINPYEASTTDMFFQLRPSYQPLQYHLYASLPPNRKSLARNERTAHDFFINDTLRESLTKKQAATLQTLPNSSLPSLMQSYHSLVPLDVHSERKDRVFGYTSTVYKAFCRQDGGTYVLRRIENFKLVNEGSIGLVEKWRKLSNANVVAVKEAFTTKAFADDSIVFVHEYHPLSNTLHDLHYGRSTRKFSATAIIGEKLIWSYFTQLVNALRSIHSMGLACRMVDPSKILVTEKNRLRVNCCGILDVIAYDPKTDIGRLQDADIAAVATIILGLAMNDASSQFDEYKLFDLTQRGYSANLDKLLKDIFHAQQRGGQFSLDDIMVALATYSMQNFDASLAYNDTLESELAQETENGRLVRLLCKFGFINERPEFEHDPAWSETGERYVLKLFRDYVFHQVDGHGKPVIDLGHVLSCLNKLDAGVEERINLVSRDEQTSVILTYKEVKRCAEQAWYGLTQLHSR